MRDGAAALDYLFSTGKYQSRQPNTLPTVVLLDLKLPKIDGLEVLRRIRADDRTKLVPVVVLTASKQDEDLLRSYSLGANAYVRKPVDFAEFAEAAKTLGLLYPSGQPRPDTRGVRDVQRLSNGQVSERRPEERDGGDFRRGAA